MHVSFNDDLTTRNTNLIVSELHEILRSDHSQPDGIDALILHSQKSSDYRAASSKWHLMPDKNGAWQKWRHFAGGAIQSIYENRRIL